MKRGHLASWLLLSTLSFTLGMPVRAVVIDGSFADWEAVDPIYINPDFSPGPVTNQIGVRHIKTTQDATFVYISYAVAASEGSTGLISFDLNRDSNLTATYSSMNAEVSWMLGAGNVVGGTSVLTQPLAARWQPDSLHPGYHYYEWCFLRDLELSDGRRLFPDPGEDVWFAVGQSGSFGSSLTGSQLTTFTIDLVPLPEPSTAMLILMGLLSLPRWRGHSAP